MANKNQPQQQAQPQQKQLSASQRLMRAEAAIMQMYQTMDNMARDLLITKDALKLLGNKLDSVVKLVNAGQPLTIENIAKVMTDNNIEELKQKCTDLVKEGVLVTVDVVPPTRGLVAGRELNDKGEIVNPRLQFTLHSQPKEVQDKIIGAKVGDVLKLAEGKASLEVIEIYEIQAPKPVSTDAAPNAAAPAEQPPTQ